MSKYIALLRGINVGGRIVKMINLKACFEDMGFQNVTSVLQSGNVLFDSEIDDIAGLRAKIESGVGERFNYPARILVYPLKQIEKIAAAYPFDTSDEGSQHYVVFLEGNTAEELSQEVTNLNDNTEEIKKAKPVIYWRVKKGMTTDSPFAKYLTKAKYKASNTVRNVKTLKKIIS